MKILYFGGQKSGKSSLAEKKALTLSTKKPTYIATYHDSYADSEMQERIAKHQAQRQGKFITIQEPKNLADVIQKDTYLIDCVSMWILNLMDEQALLSQLKTIANKEANIIFVLNEVTSGVIPMDKESRKFVDLTGIIGQKLTEICDEVYEVKFGLEIRHK
jgi:adenosylcobinamide kinase/adenosylcobinamide-phosphate guanylyltransferase